MAHTENNRFNVEPTSVPFLVAKLKPFWFCSEQILFRSDKELVGSMWGSLRNRNFIIASSLLNRHSVLDRTALQTQTALVPYMETDF